MPIFFVDNHVGKPGAPCTHWQLLKGRCEYLLRLLGLQVKNVGIVFVGDNEMQEYNRQYRHQDKPTNVLAFPASFPGEIADELSDLGDIFISVDTALREAKGAHCTLHERLTRLIIHGVLHLAGWDHERSEEEALRMWDEEQCLFQKLIAMKERKMPQLAINVDHVATVRQARGTVEPDPVLAAGICELAGAQGIVVHLREDRRHIQDRDVLLLRETVKTKLNLEMAVADAIVQFAMKIKPDMVTLVPEKRQELTTEGGLDVVKNQKKIGKVISKMKAAGIPVSLFIDADAVQIEAAAEVGATFVELHTGRYCDALSEQVQDSEFLLIQNSVELALESGLRVNAGHGLDYRNAARIADLAGIEELSIGHAIISRAVFVGLDQAVREMLQLIRQAA